MKRDLVIGIVGAFILIAAMVGVFRYEAARAGSAYDVEWATTQLAGPGDAGTAAAGDRAEVPLNVTQTNLTSIAFVLTWTDDVGSGDVFRITVVDPTGEMSQEQEGAGGELRVEFGNLSSVPLTLRILATDEAAAHAQLAAQNTADAGTGTWSIIVELVSVDGAATPGGIAIPPDNGNAWTLSSEYTVYEPRLTRV